MTDESLVQTFIEETEENLEVLETGLLELEKKPQNQELIDEVFRAMHSIKGGAGLVGLTKISDISHYLENILEEVRQANIKATEEVFTLLFSGTDLLRQMVQNNDLRGENLAAEIEDLKSALQLYHGKLEDQEIQSTETSSVQPEQSAEKRYYKVDLEFRKDIFETGTDPLMLLLELNECGNILESYVNATDLDCLYELDPHKLYIAWTVFLESEQDIEDIEDIFIFVKEDNNINITDISDELDHWFSGDKKTGELLVERGLISPGDVEKVLAKQKKIGELLAEQGKVFDGQVDKIVDIQKNFRKSKKTKTVRVETSILEGVLNDIAELLIAQSRVKDLTLDLTNKMDRSLQAELINSFQEVDKIIRQVQEEILSASMIPIGGTFTRVQRIVRDIAKERDKEVELIIKGKDTELDRRIIEQLADPLKHLVRNAIDHGIETPAKRKELGKPSKGTIKLNAFHQEGNIVIEISDDGQGIDEEAVLNKAIERGVVEVGQDLSEAEIKNLLFKPGFSTAKEVTDVSGRGVGLDVVMNNIKSIRGDIKIFSEKNEGTKFQIKLPLTLAIIDGIIIRVEEERLLIPLTSIIEFVDARKQDIKQVEGQGLIVNLRDKYIPYFTLYRLLKMGDRPIKTDEGILIILKDGQKNIALQADEIIGQEQVVIKNVKKNMGQAEGIAGATILGDGEVALILDVSSLFRLIRKRLDDGQGLTNQL
ncbi:chemotaxis protein CheA [Fuchsiella alkaliacetigena]|uniref:chemotaxis protein CheA n=1 Tax=Fuchsiella alkaliacetigena TaxID=957042 RepID=UPI00200A0520|nr:chemotaxis protein CheA [Fuchsiella alkaliacetigena]MCK8824816.1 chemotaxis protein CheA [Fuchsiella alkaliacetigena]